MLKSALKKYFNLDNFRQGQKEIIQDIVDSKNVLAIMPTGAGKSLCYQLPSLLCETYSIIISPLISLMQDQVESLNKDNVRAAYINSSLDSQETRKVLSQLNDGKIKMLFVAPEKLDNPFFVEQIKQTNPTYLFIDEAHCISQWGHNFRPSYRNIKMFADSLGIENISAFTATATPEVKNDIIKQLNLVKPSIFSLGFKRENLELIVSTSKNKKEKVLELVNKKQSSIIYTSTRKNAEQLTEFLKLKNINAEYYHAGQSTGLRTIIQNDFINNNINVIVATNAFGMGIDKPDVRLVIHYNIPGSVENLYQEFGRAGRDGKNAKVVLFYSKKDIGFQEYLIRNNHPNFEQVKLCYDAICNYHKIALNHKPEIQFEIDSNIEDLLRKNSISKNILISSLNILESGGYIQQSPPSMNKRTVKFYFTKEKLKGHIKKLSNSSLKEFLLILVKIYGGKIFAKQTTIDFSVIQNHYNSSTSNIDNQLRQLFKLGIIEYNQLSFNIKFKFLTERIKRERLIFDNKKINEQLENSLRKLSLVEDYVFTSECRFKFILNYFGENENNYKCGKCDNCNSGTTITEDKNYISEIIVRTLQEYKGGLSTSRMLGILSGKSKSIIAKSITTYGSCTHYKNDEIEKYFEILVQQNVIKNFQGNLHLNKEYNLELEPTKKNDINERSFDYENSLELYNNLREERKRFAKKFNQNPEIICPNDILKNLSKDQPTLPSEIMSVSGFTQRMYNKVGEDFLELIKEHKNKSKVNQHKNELPKHISQTYLLIEKGYSLVEIVNLLKLHESIISIQIETIISYYPKLNISSLIDKSEFELIADEIRNGYDELKEIKKTLPNSITYAKIRIVKASLSSQ